MSYAQPLPDMSELRRLVKLVGAFPANAQQLIDTAKAADYGSDTLSFLRFFHPNETFKDGLDFITRCEGMELLIDQKRQSPTEILHSSEG